MASQTFRLHAGTIRLTSTSQFIAQFFYPLLALAGVFLVWVISPNNYVALALVFLATALVFHLLMGSMNILAFLASELERLTSWTAPSEFVRLITAILLKYHGKIFHGYEVHGKENLPTRGGGLLVYHHALLPLDALYLWGELYSERRQSLGGIVDYLLYIQLLGMARLFDFFTGRDRLVADLKQGHIRSVSPGGSFEAIFSENYNLLWNGRDGFARVAKECGVPVIPMFMVNSEQAMPIKTYGLQDLQLKIREKFRFVVVLPIICFPVKLRIIIGKPLHCGPEESPGRFADRVKTAIYALRDEHQRQPGSLPLALLERFGYQPSRAKMID